jgi:lipopolysaccharide export system permease protein
MKYPFAPTDLNRTEAIKEALTTPELDRYVATEQMHGRENLNFYYIEKQRRTAQPFAGMILTIIGVSIASRKIRGGSGLHLALGIVISAIYIMFLQLSTTFSTKANLDPTIAVWIPNIVFSILAYILYRRQVR